MTDKQIKQLNTRQQSWQMVKFTLFSISAGIIQAASFTLFDAGFQFPYWLAYGLALVLSVLWNFTFNRKFTFQSAANVPRAMLLVFLFYVPFAPFTIWNEHFLADTHGWNEYAVLAINMALNLSLEYLWDNFVVYRNSKDTNDIAKKKQGKEQQHE